MSSGRRTQHLTDVEFSRLLDGAQPGSSAEMHLASCELCRQELEIVQDSLGSFRTLSTAWAEVEAPRQLSLPAKWALRSGLQTSWSAGVAATAMAGFLAFWLGFGPHPHPVPAARVAIAAPNNADLAADNRLLLSIDQELSDQTQPVVSAAELREDAQQSTHPVVSAVAD